MKIITLQIRRSGDDYEVYLCETPEIAEAIIRHFFRMEGGEHLSLEDFEEYLTDHDIGYFEITEQELLSNFNPQF